MAETVKKKNNSQNIKLIKLKIVNYEILCFSKNIINRSLELWGYTIILHATLSTRTESSLPLFVVITK